MNTDFDNLRSNSIGTINSVSPLEIKIILETDAPQSTSINTGTPRAFPRINSYVLIPNEQGAIVGNVAWIGIEHSPYPKRKGYKDFDLIDLPYPLRKMSIIPVGTLKETGKRGDEKYRLERGIYSFPSVGDIVILPSDKQLNAIVENRDENANIIIGSSPIAGNAKVRINPDRLFGRHCAVLGNTGSGKSCSVAGLIRWSIESSKEHKEDKDGKINSRFIILDPNGEYNKSFSDLGDSVKIFKVKTDYLDDNCKPLKVPAWLWNSEEWISFSQAAPGIQRPLLLDSLRYIKSGIDNTPAPVIRLNRLLNARLFNFKLWSVNPNLNWGEIQECGRRISSLQSDLKTLYIPNRQSTFTQEIITELNHLAEKCNEIIKRVYDEKRNNYTDFREAELLSLVTIIERINNKLPKENSCDQLISADTPMYFNVGDLPEYLENLAASESGRDLSQFINSLNIRIRFLIEDERTKSILVTKHEDVSLKSWLTDIIGDCNTDCGNVTIIDLSLVPPDIIHILISVLSRLIFEAIQRYKRFNKGKELPTVLVLEEAHTFIRENRFNETTYSQLCRETFEKISREGRKFGLSLVLSSQRPSELSSTVLSQCNTFLLHRIVNDRDQDLVRRLVPDSISSLLNELPILPTGKAILVGWATSIPILVEMKELQQKYRPESSDPKYWDIWIGKEERKIDWQSISDDWEGKIKNLDSALNSNNRQEN